MTGEHGTVILGLFFQIIYITNIARTIICVIQCAKVIGKRQLYKFV